MLANVASLLLDAHTFCRNLLRSRTALAAENLFLRKQLTFYQERQKRPHRTDNATRFTMVFLAQLFDREQALVVVKTATLARWHRGGFRLFWRWKSRAQGRPVIPKELQELIRRMSRDNVTWGEERIANELFVKLGLRVSPRTVRKYMPPRDNRGPHRFQSPPTWATFVRNHAQAIVAADFFTVVTVRFHFLYVFVIMNLGTP